MCSSSTKLLRTSQTKAGNGPSFSYCEGPGTPFVSFNEVFSCVPLEDMPTKVRPTGLASQLSVHFVFSVLIAGEDACMFLQSYTSGHVGTRWDTLGATLLNGSSSFGWGQCTFVRSRTERECPRLGPGLVQPPGQQQLPSQPVISVGISSSLRPKPQTLPTLVSVFASWLQASSLIPLSWKTQNLKG